MFWVRIDFDIVISYLFHTRYKMTKSRYKEDRYEIVIPGCKMTKTGYEISKMAQNDMGLK